MPEQYYQLAMGEKDLALEANKVVDIFLAAMHRKGEISEDELKSLKRYRVVLASPGLFGKAWNKLFSKPDDSSSLRYFVVEMTDELPE